MQVERQPMMDGRGEIRVRDRVALRVGNRTSGSSLMPK